MTVSEVPYWFLARVFGCNSSARPSRSAHSFPWLARNTLPAVLLAFVARRIGLPWMIIASTPMDIGGRGEGHALTRVVFGQEAAPKPGAAGVGQSHSPSGKHPGDRARPAGARAARAGHGKRG